jgi:hypothetical protein
MTVLVHFLLIWYLPILFFLAGAGSSFALKKGLDWKRYSWDRILRLGLPLIFGIFVIAAPIVYMEEHYNQQFRGSFLAFFPHFFDGIYPKGSFNWCHLWFLPYLLFFSLSTLPLIAYFKRENGQKLLNTWVDFFERGRNIFLLGLPYIIFQVGLYVKYPRTLAFINDWTTLTTFTALYLCGYIIFGDERWMVAVARNKKLALLLCLAGFATIFGVDLGLGRPAWKYSLANLSYLTVESFTTWNFILACLGYGQQFLNIDNRLYRYLNEASLPFYILHEVFVMAFGCLILPQPWGITSKFCLILLLSYISTFLTYEIAVRRIPVIRFLMGMRPRPSSLS